MTLKALPRMKLLAFSAKPKATHLRMISIARKAYEQNSIVEYGPDVAETGSALMPIERHAMTAADHDTLWYANDVMDRNTKRRNGFSLGKR
eukprot:1838519-Rhodomonas_salina.2